AGRLRVQVDAAGGRRLGLDIFGNETVGEHARGLVLANVVRVEAGYDHFADAGLAQRSDIFRRQPAGLSQLLPRDGRRVGKNGALRLADWNLAEFHAARSRATPERPRVRNASITCASTATAISAGLAAPIASPI